MSQTFGTGTRGKVSEAYAFACMNCGHGWEQSYEIEHHFDAQGREYVTYLAEGRRVPSPLTRPTCLNCDGHLVRIMRAGQVSDCTSSWAQHDSRKKSEHAEKGTVGGNGSRRSLHLSLGSLLPHRAGREPGTKGPGAAT